MVVETLPPDELPAGVPGPVGPAPPKPERDAAGRVLPGESARTLAQAGGKAKAEASKFARLMGLAVLPEDHPYRPYIRLAREHRDDHAAEIAQSIGGGKLSPGVVGLLASASLALAASRYLYDEGARLGDVKLLGAAANMADKSRTALLTAHELAAREAQIRKQNERDNPALLAEALKVT